MKLIPTRFVRATLSTAVLAAAALVAGCGGGGTAETFAASRVIALGDESSLINADGSKYTVNALVAGSTTALDCASNPIWVQAVAAQYGLVFPQCAGSVSAPSSRIRASVGATVADIGTQIDAQLADGGFTSTDLVTVLVGARDVLDQFALYPAQTEAQISDTLAARGAALAAQVNRIAGYGARVLIVTIPDMGLTPFAGDRSAGSTNPNPAVLTRLSTRFNDNLLARLLNDGHKIGLVQLDQYLKSVDTATRLGSTTFANTTGVSCAVALPGCTTATLVTEAARAVWLWADAQHLSASGQASLGSIAVSRAVNNPF